MMLGIEWILEHMKQLMEPSFQIKVGQGVIFEWQIHGCCWKMFLWWMHATTNLLVVITVAIVITVAFVIIRIPIIGFIAIFVVGIATWRGNIF